MNAYKKFVRGFFTLVAFLSGTVPIGYGIYTHNWWLVVGVFLGTLSVSIRNALKETTTSL